MNSSALRRRSLAACAVIGVASALALTGCSSSEPTIVGAWSASDGSGTKVIAEDGSCSGMYYNQGQPLDIGGGMTCALSSTSQGDSYLLTVSQPPNETSYSAVFDGDELTLSDSSGAVVVTLTRQ